MRNTIEVLEALKAKTGAPSDYALHKILGVTRQAISVYRSGNGSFSDEMALKVASILEVEPCLILAIAYADRTANTEVKAVWKTVLERVSGVAAMCLLATGICATGLSNEAVASESGHSKDNIHYAKSRNRNRRASKAKIDLSFLVQNLLGFA